MTEHRRSPRIAASSYLNTAPLIWSFISGSGRGTLEILTDKAPARCAAMLAGGEVDAALVPVIEYQRLADVVLMPNVCVGSRDAVRSVVVVTRLNNLKKIRQVALDESSRTSVALTKILFREFLGFDPDWITAPPDLKSMLRRADAALIIGDPAMMVSRDEFRVFDLATMWHEFTGLGFVFAMWMARRDRVQCIEKIDFAAARDEGLRNIDLLLIDYKQKLELPPEELRRYLRDNIVFRIDEQMEKGLNLFFQLAYKYKLIEEVKPLEFVGS